MKEKSNQKRKRDPYVYISPQMNEILDRIIERRQPKPSKKYLVEELLRQAINAPQHKAVIEGTEGVVG